MGGFDDCGQHVGSALTVGHMSCPYVWRVLFVDDVLRFHLVECNRHDVVFASVAFTCEFEFFFVLVKDIVDDFFHDIVNGHCMHLLLLIWRFGFQDVNGYFYMMV